MTFTEKQQAVVEMHDNWVRNGSKADATAVKLSSAIIDLTAEIFRAQQAAIPELPAFADLLFQSKVHGASYRARSVGYAPNEGIIAK